MIEQIDDNLLWIERKGNNAELVYCPKNTSQITSRLYFNGKERVILTSATMTNANCGTLADQYSYFISNTGFPTEEHGFLSEPKPSPYPYDEHSMIYFCDDLPHPHKNTKHLSIRECNDCLKSLIFQAGRPLCCLPRKQIWKKFMTL